MSIIKVLKKTDRVTGDNKHVALTAVNDDNKHVALTAVNGDN